MLRQHSVAIAGQHNAADKLCPVADEFAQLVVQQCINRDQRGDRQAGGDDVGFDKRKPLIRRGAIRREAFVGDVGYVSNTVGTLFRCPGWHVAGHAGVLAALDVAHPVSRQRDHNCLIRRIID